MNSHNYRLQCSRLTKLRWRVIASCSRCKNVEALEVDLNGWLVFLRTDNPLPPVKVAAHADWYTVPEKARAQIRAVLEKEDCDGATTLRP